MRICAEIDGASVVSTTELCKRLGVTVPARLLIELGLHPFAVMPNGTYWEEDDIFEIRQRLAHFITVGAEAFFESKP